MKKLIALVLTAIMVLSLAAVATVAEEKETNIASEATYEVHDFFRMSTVTWGYDEDYPIVYGDNEAGNELTDGLHAASTAYGDTAWLGINANHPNAKAGMGCYFVFNFETAYDITNAVLTLNNLQNSGIGAPEKIEAFVSTDGTTFSETAIAGAYTAALTAGESADYKIEINAKGVKAIKFLYTASAGCSWMFTDEVAIYGKAAGSGATPSVTAKATVGKVVIPSNLDVLIDGDKQSAATAFSSSTMAAFKNDFDHTSGVANAPDATVEIIYDLGEVKSISGAYLDAFEDANSMIALPDVNFQVSLDGVDYYQFNTAENGKKVMTKTGDKVTVEYATDATRSILNVRYVKITASFKNGWIFLTEVGVVEVEGGVNPAGPYAFTAEIAGNTGSGIFTTGTFDLSSEAENLRLKNAQIVMAKYDSAKGAYVVTSSKVNPWPSGHSGEVTLAKGEIMLAINTGGRYIDDYAATPKWIARGLEAGDYIVIDGSNYYMYPASHEFATGEPEKEVKKIVVDGDVNDNGWGSNWTTVNFENGYVQEAGSDYVHTFSYDYQVRKDAEKLYIAIVYNGEGTKAANGANNANGSGFNCRIWFNDGAEGRTIFSNLIDACICEDGTTGYRATKNTSLTTNANGGFAETTAFAAGKIAGGKTYMEISVDLAEIGGANGEISICVSDKKSDKSYCLFASVVPVGVNEDQTPNRNKNLPYNTWYNASAIKVADVLAVGAGTPATGDMGVTALIVLAVVAMIGTGIVIKAKH